MIQTSIKPARTGYRQPGLTKLAGRGEGLRSAFQPASTALPAMDILRVVQSAFDELGVPRDRSLVELKLRVLEEVSAGRLANAVKLAIVAAGQRGS